MKVSKLTIEMVAANARASREWTLAERTAPPIQSSSIGPNMLGDILLPQVGSLLQEMSHIRDTVENVTETIDLISTWMNNVKEIICYEGKDNFMESIFSRIEDLMLAVFTCMRSRSLADMVVPLLQYLKTFAPSKSMFLRFKDVLVSLLTKDSDGNDVEVELDPHSGTVSNNWLNVISGPFGKRLASALNVLIMVGLVPEKQEHVLSVELFKILNVQALRKEHPSILHHLFCTLDWFVDCAIPAIEQGNWSLLLFDSDMQAIDELFRGALKISNYYMSGQMDKVEKEFSIKDEAEILTQMTLVIASHEALLKKFPQASPMRKSLVDRLIKLDKVLGDLQAHWKTSAIRVQPMAVLLRGGSSVGKSSLASITAHAVCQANGYAEGPDFTCYINGADKYQSDFRSQHVCVIFDDMGNSKPERCIENPLFVLIQFINNIHCAALSPIAELKGKNDIRCKLVVVTTNTKDLHASYFSVNSASILRRFTYIVDVELKEEATSKTGGIHERFIGETHPDVWNLRVHTVHIKRSATEQLKDEPVLIPKASMNIFQYIKLLVEESPVYFEQQDAIVESATNMKDKKHCLLHKYICLNRDGSCPQCSAEGLATPEDPTDWEPTTPRANHESLSMDQTNVPPSELEPHAGKLGFSTQWQMYEQVVQAVEGTLVPQENLRDVALNEEEKTDYEGWPTLEVVQEEPESCLMSYKARIC